MREASEKESLEIMDIMAIKKIIVRKNYDYIIIGSGFGGALAAYKLACAGKDVLVVDRGKWVIRDDSCWDEIRLHIKDHLYRSKVPYYIDQKQGKIEEAWPDDTVGGMSTFYGAVSFRMREDDFHGSPVPGSAERDEKHAWPFDYSGLSPFYCEAESLLGIAGVRGADITGPDKQDDYLHAPPEKLSIPSQRLWNAAEKSDLHPFKLPMAINFSGKYGKEKCILCSTCDHYLCKIEAKNDVSVTVLPSAMHAGADVVSNTRAVRINTSGARAKSVDLIDQETGEKTVVSAENIIVSCGALSSPHLLLSSGIDAGGMIGRYLFRHANGVVVGLSPRKTNPENVLQKQIGVPDFYYGDPKGKSLPAGVWGMIQDVSSIGKGVIKDQSPFGIKNIAAFLSDYFINLMCMAEDIPLYGNRVFIDPSKKDIYGMPALMVYHRYHKRDILARRALYMKAAKILLRAGALPVYAMPFNTYSHAMGTCRMGKDKTASAVDPECRVRGMDNLYVIDASVMPSGGSVNPSLTIAAVALKMAEMMV